METKEITRRDKQMKTIINKISAFKANWMLDISDDQWQKLHDITMELVEVKVELLFNE